jgi:hypothetical protein
VHDDKGCIMGYQVNIVATFMIDDQLQRLESRAVGVEACIALISQ